MQRSFLGLILFALSSSGLLVTSNDASAEEFRSLTDVDLPGHDILTPFQELGLRNIGLEACKNACAYNKKCEAFTYNKNVRWCFLKGKASEPTPFSGAISGIRANQKASNIKAKPSEKKVAQETATMPIPVTKQAFVHREQTAAVSEEEKSPVRISIPPKLSEPAANKSKTANTKVAMNDAGSSLPILEPTYKTAAANPEVKPEVGSPPKLQSNTNSAPSRITVVPKTSASSNAKKRPAADLPGDRATTPQLSDNKPNPNQETENGPTEPGPVSDQQTVAPKSAKEPPASNDQGPKTDQPAPQSGEIRQAALTAPISQNQTQIPAIEETPESGETAQTNPTVPDEPLPIPDRKPEFKQAALNPAAPLLTSNKYAKYIHKKVGQSMYYANRANILSQKYLAKYDAERAGTKWVKSSSFGISIPMQATKSQAKALVLSKMGKDQSLEKYQDRIAYIRKQIVKPLEKLFQDLPPNTKERLIKLRDQNDIAAREFRAARDRLKAWGDKLSRHANKTWKLPSGAPLKKLHDLAADMRAKRKKALESGKIFSKALKDAIEKPITVGAL